MTTTEQRERVVAALTPEVREDLKAKALKATPGTWRREALGGSSTILTEFKPPRNDTRIPSYGYREVEEYCLAYPALGERADDVRRDYVNFSHEDAVFIVAAQPAVILSLLAALEETEGRATKFDPMRVARQIHARQHGPSVWAKLTDAGRDMYRDRLLRAIRDAELDAQQEVSDADLCPLRSESDNG